MSEGGAKGLGGSVAEGELNFVVDKAMLSISGTKREPDSVLCLSGVQPRTGEDTGGDKFIQEPALASEFNQHNAESSYNLQVP